MSEKTAFERLRDQASAENAGLLTKNNTRLAAAPAAPPPRAATSRGPKPPVAVNKKDAPAVAPARVTRASRRLAEASGDKKHKLESLNDELAVEEPAPKRVRKKGDIDLMTIAGASGIDSLENVFRSKQPGVRTFDHDEVINFIDDEASKKLVKRFAKFELYDKFPAPGLKILPYRIYSLAFHPWEERPVILVGDKEGNMGIVKAMGEESAQDEVYTFNDLHHRTITSFAISPQKHEVFSGSYDTSIRRLDVRTKTSVQVYAPRDEDPKDGISCLDMVDDNTIYFSTLGGRVGRIDLRAKPCTAELWQLSHTKIGGFSVRPSKPHHLATASLDRTLKIWDVRTMKDDEDYGQRPWLVGEHASRLSVSHAAWSASGTHVATSSYDDTVKIHSFADPAMWKEKTTFSEHTMKPPAMIHHNNQTGRWVSILKPQWQRAPKDKVDKLIIGNMNRFVDIYSADGTQLGQLGGDELTAVPAVAQFHPSMGWVAGGNASGKVSLWIGPGEDSAWQRSKGKPISTGDGPV